MPDSVLMTFFGVLEALRIVLTAPSYANIVVVACAWVLMQGPHAVTGALLRRGWLDDATRRHSTGCSCALRGS